MGRGVVAIVEHSPHAHVDGTAIYYGPFTGSFTVTAQAADALAKLGTITFLATTSAGVSYSHDGAASATASYVYSFDENASFDGIAKVVAAAPFRCAPGMLRKPRRERTDSFRVTRDADAPQVSLSAVSEGTDIAVNWNASDPASGLATCQVQYREGEEEWQSFSDQCSGTDTFEDAQPGYRYTFRLTASDNVGNEASAEAEETVEAVTKYYYFGARRVAVRNPDGVYYLHADHLGSTSLTTGDEGGVVARQIYHPFGTVRWSAGTLPTDFGFTGQRHDGTGLVFMHARYYHPVLGRFVSADTIVPEPGNPQALNRYSYVYNNPLRYTDPDGHGVKEWLERKVKEAADWLQQKTGAVVDGVWDWGTDRKLDGNLKSTFQALGIVIDWFFETDDAVQWFGPDEPLTQEVRNDPAMDEFREKWAAEGYQLPFSWPHTRDERKGPLIPRVAGGAKEYIVANVKLGLSFVGLGSSSPEGSIDPVGGVIGSFDDIYVLDAGDGMVKFEVYNVTGWASGTRIPGTNRWFLDDRPRNAWGPGGNLKQIYYWWETMPQ